MQLAGIPQLREIDGASSARTARTKARIADAVITVVAEHGLGRLTHRLVAAAAGVSLAATTYHYATKADMVADASSQLLDSYVTSFRVAAARHRAGDKVAPDMAALATKQVTNAAGRHKRTSLAWAEIILDAARSSEGHAFAREWFDDMAQVWCDLADAMGIEDSRRFATVYIDTVIGLLFITRPLALTPEQVAAVFVDGRNPAEAWAAPRAALPAKPAVASRPGRKAQDTRQRILDAAIGLLIARGVGAITYKAVAEASGLTTAAPAYHFGSITQLLNAAEAELFQRSKEQYREIRTAIAASRSAIDELADSTAALFVREATDLSLSPVAIYSIWLEAARRPDLRSEVSEAIFERSAAWTRQMRAINPATQSRDAMWVQALYVGMMVRTISTGSPPDIGAARSAFRQGFAGDASRL